MAATSGLLKITQSLKSSEITNR